MLETEQKLKNKEPKGLAQTLSFFRTNDSRTESRLYFVAVGSATLATIVAALLIVMLAPTANAFSLWVQVGTAALVLAFNVFGDRLTTFKGLSTRDWQLGAAVLTAIVLVAAFFAGEYLTVLLAPLVVSLAQRRRDQLLLIKVALSAIGLILLEYGLMVVTGWSNTNQTKEQGVVTAIIVISTIALSLASLIRNYDTEISSYQKEQETKASEMEIAHEIQTSLMPPSEIVTGPWSFAAKSLPARDVGGDFYEYIPYFDRGIGGVAIGDVAGKGIPAALQMAVVRTLFRVEARRRIFPAETLMSVNMALQAERSFGMVTLLYGFVDQASATLHLSNAGHNYPIILNGSLTEVRMPGLPLGIDDGIEYEEVKVHITPGTSIIFYTDGVIEAMNEAGDLYGFQRLREVVTKLQDCDPPEMVNRILADVSIFTENAPQSDDITVVVIQREHGDQDDNYDPNLIEKVATEVELEKAMVAVADSGAEEEYDDSNWI